MSLGGLAQTSSESVPQLDGIAIMPPNEIGSDALGNIPELPANEKHVDPFETPASEVVEASQEGNNNGGRTCCNPNKYAMSAATSNSIGNQNTMSRLSQPHAVPGGGAWEDISLNKKV